MATWREYRSRWIDPHRRRTPVASFDGLTGGSTPKHVRCIHGTRRGVDFLSRPWAPFGASGRSVDFALAKRTRKRALALVIDEIGAGFGQRGVAVAAQIGDTTWQRSVSRAATAYHVIVRIAVQEQQGRAGTAMADRKVAPFVRMSGCACRSPRSGCAGQAGES
jgi:hypothetical protein